MQCSVEEEHDGFGDVSLVNPTGSQAYLDVEIKRRESSVSEGFTLGDGTKAGVIN